MMNIQGANAADAASSSKLSSAGKKGSDNGDGFSDALSGLDQDSGAQRAKSKDDTKADSEAKTGADEDSISGQDQPADDAAPVKQKPIIDIRPESLRKSIATKVDLSNLKQQVEAAKDDAIKDVPKDASRALTASEKKLKEALAAAKALTEKADALEGKKADAAADDTELDIEALLAADQSVKLEDVLSLLNGQGAAVALESMAPVAKSQGGQAKRSQDDVSAIRGKADIASALNALSTNAADAATQAEPVAGTKVPTEEDRLFRFQSAKDERKSMDMIIGANAGGDRSAETRSSVATETVTVLDSRRFLGLAPNAASLTAALSGDSEWAAAMQSTSAAQEIAAQNPTGSVVNTLKLQMNPHNLGSITAMLRLQGEQLHVHLTVETRAAYRQLADDSAGIVDALKSQGFAVDQVTISIAPTADSDTANNQQQNGQQSAAQGDRQGSTADRGQENASRRQASQEHAGHGNEGKSDSSAAAGADGARSGQLYL